MTNNTNKLFLICPDCYIEPTIRKVYGDEIFFITALGTVFDIENFHYAEEVAQFISGADVMDIYIVNDVECSFIQSALQQKELYDTRAMHVLLDIVNRREEDISRLANPDQQAAFVAKTNILRQAYELTEVAFIGNKILDHKINVKGLIFDRKLQTFTDVPVVF